MRNFNLTNSTIEAFFAQSDNIFYSSSVLSSASKSIEILVLTNLMRVILLSCMKKGGYMLQDTNIIIIANTMAAYHFIIDDFY